MVKEEDKNNVNLGFKFFYIKEELDSIYFIPPRLFGPVPTGTITYTAYFANKEGNIFEVPLDLSNRQFEEEFKPFMDHLESYSLFYKEPKNIEDIIEEHSNE